MVAVMLDDDLDIPVTEALQRKPRDARWMLQKLGIDWYRQLDALPEEIDCVSGVRPQEQMRIHRSDVSCPGQSCYDSTHYTVTGPNRLFYFISSDRASLHAGLEAINAEGHC